MFKVKLTHVFKRSWSAGEEFIGEERIRLRREVIMFRRWEDVVVYFWEVDWKPFRIVVKRRVNRRTPFSFGEVKILGWGTIRRAKRGAVSRGAGAEERSDELEFCNSVISRPCTSISIMLCAFSKSSRSLLLSPKMCLVMKLVKTLDC